MKDKLKKMSKVNNTLKIDKYTVYYSTSNLGSIVGLNDGRYYDIMGADGIEGEYMTINDVLVFFNKKEKQKK